MGWTFARITKQQAIQELTEPWQGKDCSTVTLKQSLQREAEYQVLWTVRQTTYTDGRPPVKWIGCDLLDCAPGETGYKSMDESMGPYFNTCPVQWFDEVPQPEGDSAAEFRQRIRARHQLAA